jgi:hypothetical protein
LTLIWPFSRAPSSVLPERNSDSVLLILVFNSLLPPDDSPRFEGTRRRSCYRLETGQQGECAQKREDYKLDGKQELCLPKETLHFRQVSPQRPRRPSLGNGMEGYKRDEDGPAHEERTRPSLFTAVELFLGGEQQ